MRVVIQRVTNAMVTVDNEVIGSIGPGLCLYIGLSSLDTQKDLQHVARRVLNMKVYSENNKRWKKSVVDQQLEILCISEFTLYSCWKGNKPDFHKAMAGDKSQVLYNEFVQLLKDQYDPSKIQEGKFGSHMQVTLLNDGPVTFQIESPLNSEHVDR